MRSLLPLQSQGTGWIDINGLNKKDQRRIKEVGFNQWIDEISGIKTLKDMLGSKYRVEVQPQFCHDTLEVKVTEVKDADLVSKLKAGSVGYELALKFFRLARANSNIVTYEQAAILCPAYPKDPALWARETGAEVITERKNKRYVVVKYA